MEGSDFFTKDMLLGIFYRTPNHVYFKDRRFVYRLCNRNYLNYMGAKEPEDVIGKSDFDLFENKDNANLYRSEDLKILQTGEGVYSKEVPAQIDGEDCFLLVSKAPVYNKEGEIIGILGIQIDITENKRAEIAIVAAKKKAEVASKAKSEFIANMSHDLRTPMTGVMGMLDEIDLLANDASDVLPTLDKHAADPLKKIIDNIKQHAAIAQESNKELLSMFNDILEMIKLDSGKVEYNKESFRLRSLIQKQEILMTPVAKDKGIKLFVNIDSKIPEFVTGYWDPLSRSINNLLSNACKFTKNGSVTVGVTALFDGECKVGDSIPIKIWVKDTGVGIPEDKFEEIFGHFYKLESSYKNSSYQGSGLGLHSVKQYVNYMGGTIDLDSKIGEGTCFSISLTMLVADRSDRGDDISEIASEFHDTKEEVSNFSEEANDASGSVLVVEDNPTAAQSVMNALTRLGYKSDWASNGEEAVDMAAANDYSIIFMDIGLPKLNGLEATEKIRAINDQKRSQVPIVALTGHEDRVKECTDAGMQGLMQKPAQSNKIKEILAKQGLSSQPKLDLPIVDWDECVAMCCGEDEAKQIISMCCKVVKDSKKVIAKHYQYFNVQLLRDELHKARGGVCYLKLPELEYCLRDFHVAVKKTNDKEDLDRKYKALVVAEDRFIQFCVDKGLL